MEAPLWPRILKIGAPSQNKLGKKWTLRSWEPLLTNFAAPLMNATNGVGRNADRLQSLNPRCWQLRIVQIVAAKPDCIAGVQRIACSHCHLRLAIWFHDYRRQS